MLDELREEFKKYQKELAETNREIAELNDARLKSWRERRKTALRQIPPPEYSPQAQENIEDFLLSMLKK